MGQLCSHRKNAVLPPSQATYPFQGKSGLRPVLPDLMCRVAGLPQTNASQAMFEKFFPSESFKPQSPAETSLLVWMQKLERSGHDKVDLICCTLKGFSGDTVVIALAVFRLFVPTRSCITQYCLEPVAGTPGLFDKCGKDSVGRFCRTRCLVDPGGQEIAECDSFEEFLVVGDAAPTKAVACDSLAAMFDALLCQMQAYSKDTVLQPKENPRFPVQEQNPRFSDCDWGLYTYFCLRLGDDHPKGTCKVAFLARRFGLGTVGHPPPGSSGSVISCCKSEDIVGMY